MHKRSPRALGLAALCGLALLALECSDRGEAPSAIESEDSVSFAADIQSIFTPSCRTVNGCHSSTGHTGDMVLDPGVSYSQLVNVVSFGYAPSLRVAPGDRDASVLFQKLLGNPAFGDKMPLVGTLSPEQIETIGVWIDEGALNN